MRVRPSQSGTRGGETGFDGEPIHPSSDPPGPGRRQSLVFVHGQAEARVTQDLLLGASPPKIYFFEVKIVPFANCKKTTSQEKGETEVFSAGQPLFSTKDKTWRRPTRRADFFRAYESPQILLL